MNKTELIKAIAENGEFSQVDATKFLSTFVQVVEDALRKDDQVVITGFGTFKATTRPAHKSRNPQTGEEIEVPESKNASFKAGKLLKENIK